MRLGTTRIDGRSLGVLVYKVRNTQRNAVYYEATPNVRFPLRPRVFWGWSSCEGALPRPDELLLKLLVSNEFTLDQEEKVRE